MLKKYRRCLKCSICMKSYHIYCVNVSIQRFHLMAKERKCTCVCNETKNNNKTSANDIDIMSKADGKEDVKEENFKSTILYAEYEYVTLRKKRKASSMNINDNVLDTNCSVVSFCSVPDLSMRKRDLRIEQLKDEIEEVRAQMRGVDEIEKLVLENNLNLER